MESIKKKIKTIQIIIFSFLSLLCSCDSEGEFECELNLGGKTQVSCSEGVEVKKVLVACVEYDTLFFAIVSNPNSENLSEVTTENFIIQTNIRDNDYLKDKQVYIEAELTKDGRNYYVNQFLHKGDSVYNRTIDLNITY